MGRPAWIAVVTLTVAVAASAYAQAPAAPPAGAAAPASKPAPRRGPQKVIEMDPLEVIGKVQKPHVFYVIKRGDLKYQGMPLERSMLKELEESVAKPPF